MIEEKRTRLIAQWVVAEDVDDVLRQCEQREWDSFQLDAALELLDRHPSTDAAQKALRLGLEENAFRQKTVLRMLRSKYKSLAVPGIA